MQAPHLGEYSGMAYWWVFQGTTYLEESAGQYLWAPGPGSSNMHHWANMDRVRPGDVIFSYYKQAIFAVTTARSAVELAPPPVGYNVPAWEGMGRRIAADYTPLAQPLKLADVNPQTLQLLAVSHGPLNKNFTGNQGYLYPISEAAAHGLLAAIDRTNPPLLVDGAVANSAPSQANVISLQRLASGRDNFDPICSSTGAALVQSRA